MLMQFYVYSKVVNSGRNGPSVIRIALVVKCLDFETALELFL